MNRDRLEDDFIKILMIGDACVGKTSFIERYVHDTFNENYKCTIGFDCVSKTVRVNGHGRNGSTVKLQLWDIAGQERFPSLSRAYYRYARGCIIMFDLTRTETFHNVRKWKKALDSHTREDYLQPIPCMLVGNKKDLPRMIQPDQIEGLCNEMNAVQWTETSIKEGTNVNEAIMYLLDVILEQSPSVYEPTEYQFVDVVDLRDFDEKSVNPKRRSCKLCQK